MKYLSLQALIIGFTFALAGCYPDSGYDITRAHDIYRIHYKYKPLPESSAPLLPASDTSPNSRPMPPTMSPAAPATAPAPAIEPAPATAPAPAPASGTPPPP